jgi:PAS domain S-box-containing protein
MAVQVETGCQATDAPLSEADGIGLLDEVYESVIVRDMAGHVRFWNRSAETIYGLTRAQALGGRLDDLLGSAHPDGIAGLERRLIEAGHWEGELLRTTAAGDRRQVAVRWRLRRDPAGTPSAVVEFGRDVTGIPDREAESRLAAHRYRNLFQAMAASFWELDFTEVRRMVGALRQSGVVDLRAHFAAHPEFIDAALAATSVIDVNDKTVRLFGAADRDALLGATVPTFWPAASRPAYAEALIAAAERRPNYATETRLATVDGREIDVLFTVCWPEAHRGRGSVLVGIIDISEQKAAEAEIRRAELQYRTLFHALSMALVQVDTRGSQAMMVDLRSRGVADLSAYIDSDPGFVRRAMEATTIIDVNEAAIRILGARERTDLIGMSVARFWPIESEVTFRHSIEAAFRQEPGIEEETRLAKLDGSAFDALFSVNAPPTLRARGAVLVGIVDISERVAAQRALRQLQAEFAHAARLSMLGELVASIAHEVNQPLAAIAANAAAGKRWLARAEPDLDEVRQINDRIVADAHRAADIIARMRDMAAKRGPDQTSLSLNGMVEEAMMFLHHELQAHRVAVTLDLAPDLPPAHADRTQIQQVLVNLALNAIQEMARSGTAAPRLTIRTRPSDRATLQVEIEDSGPGVAPEHRNRLFDSFYTTKQGGLGMGLAICRSIVEAHGGRIRAEPVPVGACFAFTLPAAR